MILPRPPIERLPFAQGAAALAVALALAGDPAIAFENALPLPESKSAPLPRKPGPAPTDIGIQSLDKREGAHGDTRSSSEASRASAGEGGARRHAPLI